MKIIFKEDHLLIKIESTRKEMIKCGLEEGLASNKTIELSQRLDQYIIEYQSMDRENNLQLIPFN